MLLSTRMPTDLLSSQSIFPTHHSYDTHVISQSVWVIEICIDGFLGIVVMGLRVLMSNLIMRQGILEQDL